MNLAAWRSHWSHIESWLRLAPWVIVLIFATAGYRAMLPPSPIEATAPDAAFSAERAADHVAAISVEPHPMGSATIEAVREYITGELAELGIGFELQSSAARDYYGDAGSVPVVNIVARIPGTADTRAVALVAHYDTHPRTPGANDNGAAVGALLETGRALLAGPSLHNDVVLLFTDAEEPAPRYGANAFAADHPTMQDIGLVVNFEALGGSGASVLVETNGPQGWLTAELAKAVSRPTAFSSVTAFTNLLGEIGTDFDVFTHRASLGFEIIGHRPGKPFISHPVK